MYFNSTISDSTKLLKPVLVFAFAMAAVLTGLTQITQHRSHPVDVYVGFLIGAFIAAYLVRPHICELSCSCHGNFSRKLCAALQRRQVFRCLKVRHLSAWDCFLF